MRGVVSIFLWASVEGVELAVHMDLVGVVGSLLRVVEKRVGCVGQWAEVGGEVVECEQEVEGEAFGDLFWGGVVEVVDVLVPCCDRAAFREDEDRAGPAVVLELVL